jgi:Zn-dependent protease with chaperone function
VDRNRLELAAHVVLFVVISVVTFDVFLSVFGGCLLLAVFLEMGVVAPLLYIARVGPLAGIGTLSLGLGVVALAWAIFTLSRSERWLIRRFGAQFVPKGELLNTKMVLKDMAIASGMPVAPALYLIENSNVNAFVFAARRRRAVVGVTRGFVNRLELDEQRAVFANLVARLISGDTIVSTGVTALLWPLHVWRERRFDADNKAMDRAMLGDTTRSRSSLPVVFFVFGVAFAIMAEIFALGHRRKQLRIAEKADAEGMLLLKDPHSMLRALEKCVRYDNVVPLAGEAFGDLFYCWTGDSTNDEDDPEWARVARLREVLGVEGHVGDASVPLVARS